MIHKLHKHDGITVDQLRQFNVARYIYDSMKDLVPSLSVDEEIDIWMGEGEFVMEKFVCGWFWKAYLDGFDIKTIVNTTTWCDTADAYLDRILTKVTPSDYSDRNLPDWLKPAIVRTKNRIKNTLTEQLKYPRERQTPTEYVGSITYVYFDTSGKMAPSFETIFASRNVSLHKLDGPSLVIKPTSYY